MARLKKGETPTPHKERLKLYRQELEASGGRRLSVDLNKEATQAIDTIIKKHKAATAKEAVTIALIAEAKRG